MSRELNPMQVWSQVPLANRTITVSDKTGFSLTAGSYSVRASSTQAGVTSLTSTATTANAAISSVTTTRAKILDCLVTFTIASTEASKYLNRIAFTSATNVQCTAGSSQDLGANTATHGFMVEELF